MPKNTPVHRCYDKLKGKRGKSSAAKICQAATGKSLKTGKKPKAKPRPKPQPKPRPKVGY